jgi:hypothetical protein
MQTEFKAIVQSEHGAPEKVLRLAKRQLKSEEPGSDDVLVKVIARPIHHGDIHILSGLPQGGPVETIPKGTVGVDANRLIQDVMSDAHADRLREGFFSGERSGVNGTPAFFVNGVRYDGPLDGLFAALTNNS